MSFRGGAPRGRGGFGGGRGGRGGFQANTGPPAQIVELGTFVHACEGEMICSSTNVKIPYFNGPIYNAAKAPLGKVDEILGPINEVYFTVKPQEGIQATSFKQGDKVYIGTDKLLPLEKFLPRPVIKGAPKPKRAGGASRGGPMRGGGRGAPRGRGGFAPRGRGAPRGAPRGGSRGGGGFSRGGGGGGFRGTGANSGGFTPRAGFGSRGRGGY